MKIYYEGNSSSILFPFVIVKSIICWVIYFLLIDKTFLGTVTEEEFITEGDMLGRMLLLLWLNRSFTAIFNFQQLKYSSQ